ncbi:MAG: bifunctional phosphoribosylaminoimidazolecarboxamide formyltransferase/IMP cyclohydrolase [Bryobacteraceae bacterium]|nr:bifunctional phosphoribosylaminoimidazolecarboxamide formyltransferase/IMP cyclohydrolase [Bryobacteraceae bacterium]
MPQIKRALISVTDKTGVVEFTGALHQLGIDIVSTGGTASAIRGANTPVRDIAELTGFPEMLDGRVKTIHPRVAAGILAIRSNASHLQSLVEHGIGLIDMVVVNLYAFEKVAARPDATVHELIENIDIGGPTMIRAAAKNWQDVAVVTRPEDYDMILEELRTSTGSLSAATCWRLAKQAFELTALYDRAVTARLASLTLENGEFQDRPTELPEVLVVQGPRVLDLRYGENPHQKAALYSLAPRGIASAKQLHGKELSYNNLVDLDAAWQLIAEFAGPAAAIIKHTNPCGCAEQNTLAEAYLKAFEADPVSAFGGVLAFNREVDEETASEIAKTFIEAIAAPGYSQAALGLLTAKRNLRLLEVGPGQDALVLKSVSGGILAQTPDQVALDRNTARVVTKRAPTEEEWRALEFGWKVCKHVKSNAIVFARAGQSVSAGAGQMSRLDSVKMGALKAVLSLEGTVLASDAFFPFPDGVEEAAKHGITAVVQPGGSVKDDAVIHAADRLGLAMVFTGIRHFRH